MATKTKRYGLTKPDVNDSYDIGVFNENMDIIEEEMAGHGEKRDNPHNVTAEQVGALPITGGMLTGKINIKTAGFDGSLMLNHGYGNRATLYCFENISSSYRSLMLNNGGEAPNVANALQMFDTANGSGKSYHIFGEHNKPNGSYTGNGSMTTRTIAVNAPTSHGVLIVSQNGIVILTAVGAFSVSVTGSMTYILPANIKFDATVITLATEDDTLNKSGVVYYYTVL